VVVGLLAGCSVHQPPSVEDAGPFATDALDGPGDSTFVIPQDGTTDTLGTVSGGCSTLMNTAPQIAEVVSHATMPIPSGGQVVNGWYDLTSATVYSPDDGGADRDAAPDGGGGFDAASEAGMGSDGSADATPAGRQRQEAVLVISGVVYAVTRNGSAASKTLTYTLATTGTSATLTEVCPTMQPTDAYGYDATATGLSLYYAAERRVDGYTLRH
jgi:hypothetical protein